MKTIAQSLLRTALLPALIVLAADGAQARAQAVLNGRLVAAVHDSLNGGSSIELTLVDDRGGATKITTDGAVIRRAGGMRSIVNRRLAARLVPDGGPAADGFAAAPLRATSFSALEASQEPSSVTGALPFAVLLCRFANAPGVTPGTVARAQQAIGSTFPGADHYWREVSESRVTLAGSTVYGWYNMTQTYDYYYGSAYRSRFATDYARDMALRDDCATAADATVYFPSFEGIAMQFNVTNPSSYAYFGAQPMTRDGVTKNYRTAYLFDWAINESGTYAHEIGHTFGLYHSSGDYGVAYDSQWDVMSNSRTGTDASTSLKFGTHTIAYHKDYLNWIPAARKWTPGNAAGNTFVIERSALAPTTGFQMAQIPISVSAGTFYTVEARRFAGLYDARIPLEGIVINKLDPSNFASGAGQGPARIVDPDNNGNPNDAGAVWVPGETFTDNAAGVSISVVSATATGYTVTIGNGGASAVAVVGSGTGDGSVTSAPAGISCSIRTGRADAVGCSASFTNGSNVVLTATPAAGSAFSGWSGACSGTSTCQVAVNGAKSVTATFQLLTFALTVAQTGAGAGSVASQSGLTPALACSKAATVQTSCNATYTSNQTVALTATPAANATFTGWTGDCTGTGTCTLAMNRAHTVTAAFGATTSTFALTLTGAGTGVGVVSYTGSATGCTITAGITSGQCTGSYGSGTTVTLLAQPSAGSSFTGWSNACTGTISCAVTMTQARTATATFARTTNVIALTNGVAVTGVANAVGALAYYSLVVPAGAQLLQVRTTGGTGDLDLYVALNTLPTTTSYACASEGETSAEVCNITPSAGTYNILLSGYTAYSGVTLQATYINAGATTTVAVNGTGTGRVQSSVGGISCDINAGVTSGVCSATVVAGASIGLTAAPGSFRSFGGWTGPCASLTSIFCSLTPLTPTVVSASFPTVSITPLSNGVTSQPVSGSENSYTYFSINVPQGATRLDVATTGISGDADLYVQLAALPASGFALCSSEGATAAESCSLSSPAAGTWYIAIHGFSDFTGVKTTATYVSSGVTLAVTPVSRSDSVLTGATATRPDSAVVTLSGPASATATWTATKRGAWTTLSTASGTGSSTLRWSRNPTGLAVGAYIDTITVTAPAATAGPVRVIDTLRVLPQVSTVATASLSPDSIRVGTGQSVFFALKFALPGTAVKLGSYAARLTWDSTVIRFDSVRAAQFVAPLSNLVSAGELRLSATDTAGTGGTIDLAKVYFTMITTTAGRRTTIVPAFDQAVASQTGTNLVAGLSVKTAQAILQTACVITASALPATAGAITGGGTCVVGQLYGLVATATPVYAFSNWTEGSTVVSTNPAYSFIPTGNRTLVANFTATSGAPIVARITNFDTLSVAAGATVALPVRVDMSQAGGRNVAAITITVSWDTTRFTYVSNSGGDFGSIAVDTSARQAGLYRASAFSSDGVTSSFTIRTLSLQARSAGASSVTLTVPVAGNEAGQSILSNIGVKWLRTCVAASGLRGDANGDGAVNVIDAQQVARYSINLSVADAVKTAANGDANDDGAVNVIDAQQIARFAVGLSAAPKLGQLITGCTP